MKVLFLTEYGDGVGYGHINRCIALADGFNELNCEITFLTRGSNDNFYPNRDYHFINKEWNNKVYLEETLREFDITVIDSYQVPDSTLKYIGENSRLPVYLIDSKLKFYPAGIVLFPSIYAQKSNFNIYKNLNLISGIDHLLFTKELWNKRKYRINERIQNIGITLGGIANKSLINILSVIQNKISQLKEISVFGNVNSKVQKQLDLEFCKIKGFLTKKEYVRQLKQVDIMICNGGQSLNECLLLGVPTVSLICADNQVENSKAWERLGIAMSMDIRNVFDEKEFAYKLEKMDSFAYRNKTNKKCLDLIDHEGSVRSAERILEIKEKK